MSNSVPSLGWVDDARKIRKLAEVPFQEEKPVDQNGLSIPERLIIAIDIEPGQVWYGGRGLEAHVHQEIEVYQDLGVTLKFNAVLRVLGYSLLSTVRSAGLSSFADLKLNDIPHTLKNDAEWLRLYPPDLLTVMCSVGESAMRELSQSLPVATELLGVTVLTSFTDGECARVYGKRSAEAVEGFCRMAKEAGVDGLILSPQELEVAQKALGPKCGMTFNCPGIRPEWHQGGQDDQKRVMTPKGAIAAGADRIVVGRPIRRAEVPRDAVKRTLDEIEAGLAARVSV